MSTLPILPYEDASTCRVYNASLARKTQTLPCGKRRGSMYPYPWIGQYACISLQDNPSYRNTSNRFCHRINNSADCIANSTSTNKCRWTGFPHGEDGHTTQDYAPPPYPTSLQDYYDKLRARGNPTCADVSASTVCDNIVDEMDPNPSNIVCAGSTCTSDECCTVERRAQTCDNTSRAGFDCSSLNRARKQNYPNIVRRYRGEYKLRSSLGECSGVECTADECCEPQLRCSRHFDCWDDWMGSGPGGVTNRLDPNPNNILCSGSECTPAECCTVPQGPSPLVTRPANFAAPPGTQDDVTSTSVNMECNGRGRSYDTSGACVCDQSQPDSSGGIVAWTHLNASDSDARQACEVKMRKDMPANSSITYRERQATTTCPRTHPWWTNNGTKCCSVPPGHQIYALSKDLNTSGIDANRDNNSVQYLASLAASGDQTILNSYNRRLYKCPETDVIDNPESVQGLLGSTGNPGAGYVSTNAYSPASNSTVRNRHITDCPNGGICEDHDSVVPGSTDLCYQYASKMNVSHTEGTKITPSQIQDAAMRNYTTAAHTPLLAPNANFMHCTVSEEDIRIQPQRATNVPYRNASNRCRNCNNIDLLNSENLGHFSSYQPMPQNKLLHSRFSQSSTLHMGSVKLDVW